MIKNEAAAIKGDRIHWMDNLRTFMILLVVVIHCGLVYESSGIVAFFWIVDDPATNDISGLLNLIFDIFVMPTIFFISGFFAPMSLRAGTGLAFLRSKFKRLLIPWAAAVLTLIPLYKIIFLASRNLPQEHWTTYFHWSNGIWGQNWLWFLPVLFACNAIYLFISKMRIGDLRMTLKRAVMVCLLLGAGYGIGMSVFGLVGWTKTLLIDFQNERVFIYLLVFLLGALCHGLGTFESKPKGKKLYIILACTAWIPMNLYLITVIHMLIKPGQHIVSRIGDLVLIQCSYLLSLACLMYLTIQTFRFFLNRQSGIGRAMSANSYSVYIIHTIVLGGVALAMLDTALPSLIKHLILVLATFGISNLLSTFFRNMSRHLMKRSLGMNWRGGMKRSGGSVVDGHDVDEHATDGQLTRREV